MQTVNIDQLANETIAILKGRATNAIRFCEAYEGTRRTIVVDGSMFSPSDRALPNGERVWELDDPELFEQWSDLVDRFVNDFALPEDSDSEAPDEWSLSWDEGMLVAELPAFED